MNDFLHWYVPKVLPLVYDDTLTLYECIGKMLVKVNEIASNQNKIVEFAQTYPEEFAQLEESYEEFKTLVENNIAAATAEISATVADEVKKYIENDPNFTNDVANELNNNVSFKADISELVNGIITGAPTIKSTSARWIYDGDEADPATAGEALQYVQLLETPTGYTLKAYGTISDGHNLYLYAPDLVNKNVALISTRVYMADKSNEYISADAKYTGVFDFYGAGYQSTSPDATMIFEFQKLGV